MEVLSMCVRPEVLCKNENVSTGIQVLHVLCNFSILERATRDDHDVVMSSMAACLSPIVLPLLDCLSCYCIAFVCLLDTINCLILYHPACSFPQLYFWPSLDHSSKC